MDKKPECQRVTLSQAAKEIGCIEQYLRLRMRNGDWDLGVCVKPTRGKKNWTYFIFRDKLDRFLGRWDGSGLDEPLDNSGNISNAHH
jgi:hypothetical protein